MKEKKDMQPDTGQQARMEPGELGFLIILLLIGLFFLYQSILLYRAYPGLENCSAVPLVVSIIIAGLSLLEIITALRKGAHRTGGSAAERLKACFAYLFSKQVLVILGLIVLYCIGLFLGIGFIILTPIFLFVSMCFLQKGDYKKNILWTAIIMAFIILVFQELFNIILP